jgi:hypothetical protein
LQAIFALEEITKLSKVVPLACRFSASGIDRASAEAG